MKCIIIKDYIWEGNHTLGTFSHSENNEDYYMLEDGDVYSEKMLKEDDFKYILISSEEIIKKFIKN